MTTPVDFYFDFSSPYGYFAASQLDELCARYGRTTIWRPILLGAVFKITRQQALTTIPLKSNYAAHDLKRSARWFKLPFQIPSPFPISTTAACRAYYWLYDRDAVAAKALAMTFYQEYFVNNQDISSPEVCASIAATLGHDHAAVTAAFADPQVKMRLQLEVDAAIECGVFGSPYIVVDGEPFWGADRLPQLERWLAQGPW